MRLLTLTILVAASATNARAQTAPPPIARAELAAATAPAGDTTDHIDLAIHRGAALSRAGVVVRVFDSSGARISSGYGASWSSSNPGVASVTAGVVRAIAPGVVVIAVTVARAGGVPRSAQLVACVTDTGASSRVELRQWPAVTVDPRAPWQQPTVRLMPGESRPFAALDTAGRAWPPACVHWAVSSSAAARISRRGELANSSSGALVVTTGGRGVDPALPDSLRNPTNATAVELRARVGPP